MSSLLLSPIKVNSLEHGHGTVYNYSICQEKLEKLSDGVLFPLQVYLSKVFDKCPSALFLGNGPRSSQLRIPLNVPIEKIDDHEICKMTGLALKEGPWMTNHEKVQTFMLLNDPHSIAAEIPVWINYFEDPLLAPIVKSTHPVTGHIDLVQIKDGKIWILDFKPNAHREKWAATQTYFYARMLAKRSGLSLENFRCGWFDQHTSYWFNPNEVTFAENN